MSSIENSTWIRLAFFIGILLIMIAWEIIAPKRMLTLSKPTRWVSNLGLVILDTAFVRFLLPFQALEMGLLADQNKWGIFNQTSISLELKIILSVILLDFIIYLQHVMFHAIPLLWRLHMIHHADQDIDVTTGVRFHPIEILISMGIKISAVLLLGPPVVALIAFEVLLNTTSLFNHSNVRMPLTLDWILRLVVVTPDMHRIHHSVCPQETNSNFGFNLPFWDRLFGTYRAQPEAGHQKMTIGLSQFRSKKTSHLGWILISPFKAPTGNYPINGR